MIAKVIRRDQILEHVVCGVELVNAIVQKMRSAVHAAKKSLQSFRGTESNKT
jgi:hypothetical protein